MFFLIFPNEHGDGDNITGCLNAPTRPAND